MTETVAALDRSARQRPVSSTVANLLIDLDRGYGLAPGSVLVVDEAGMAGTRTIAVKAG